MKRLLLCSIAFMYIGSLLAQNSQNLVPKKVALFPTMFSSDPSATNVVPLNKGNVIMHHPSGTFKNTYTRSVDAVTINPFASSGNAYTLLVSQSNCLNANQTLNLIAFTHRACNSFATLGNGNIGWINTSFSLDGGNTWDTSLLVMHEGGKTTDTGCRYPSGAIYNPIGNSDPSKAFSIVCGPYTDNTNWTGYYFGSASFRDTLNNDNEQIYAIVDTPTVAFEYLPRIGMTYAGNHAFSIGYNQYLTASTGSSDGVYHGLVLNKGTFNSSDSAFTWQFQDVNTPVANNPAGGQYVGNTDMAWSLDGSIGYIVVFGVDSSEFVSGDTMVSFYPIVFKSTDSGQTWSKLPYFDFSTLPVVTANLLANSSGRIKPFIAADNGDKLVVDYNNNLHIITDVESAYSNNPDSLGYSIASHGGNLLPSYIYDLETTDGTNWQAVYLDTVQSEATTSQVWSSSSGGIETDARIQAATTSDRKKVFVTWLDTQLGIGGGYNDYPDVYSKGLDYTDNYITPTVNFTSSSNFAEQCYWLYVSTTAFSNSGTYTIPATVSLNSSYDADDPIEHYFVSGITFSDPDFASGIPSIAKSNIGLGIYPNPSSGELTLSFTKYTGQASIFVTNILGSTVKQINNVNIANNNITLNLSDLTSGIYFVRVQTTQGSETQKIVIAKD